MKKQQTPAQTTYEAAVDSLQKFCEKETELIPSILDDGYPIHVQFIPKPQLTVFGNENIDENGEVNDLTVTVGLTTSVKSTLKFKMDSKLLKKLIKLAEMVGSLYYHAFREEQVERIRPARLLISEDGENAYCPDCGVKIPDESKPACCPGCGRCLDWTPESSEDAYEEGLEKLRRTLDKAKETKQ